MSTSFYRAFGPCGVELLAHVAQRLFPSDSIVLQTIEVDSTVADPADIGTLRVEVNPRADAEQVVTYIYVWSGSGAFGGNNLVLICVSS